MQLEKHISSLFKRLPFFWTKMNERRLHDGTYVQGEPFDYIVIREGTTYCFDAKEASSKDILYASNIPAHQFNDMLKAENNGAKVFFLIYFVKAKKIKFIHPKTILDDKKATPFSEETNNDLIKEIRSFVLDK